MEKELEAGLTTTARIEVDEARTISFMGDDVRVYATPNLLYDIEMTCRDLLPEYIDDGQDSVGTHIDLSPLAATPLGLSVELSVGLSVELFSCFIDWFIEVSSVLLLS